MTNEIQARAQFLAEAIAQCKELAELRRTEQAMGEDEEAQRIIQEFQEAQGRLAAKQQAGEELTETENQQVAAIEEKVEKNPLIAAYLEAQDRFTELLDSVNAILAGAIAGEANDGCAGCSSGACGPGCGCGEA